MKKYVITNYKQFSLIKEDVEQTPEEHSSDEKLSNHDKELLDEVSTKVEVTKTLSPYERIERHIKYKSPAKYTLVKRGGDETTNNPDVIKKGEDVEHLDVSKDSERLEYCFRKIAEDINKTLSEGKIEKDGKELCKNIRKEDYNGKLSCVFDFTFENDDSVNKKGEKMKGKTETKLAGELEKTPGFTEIKDLLQVSVNINSQLVKSVKDQQDGLAMMNYARKLIEAGYEHIQGTYNYQLKNKIEWIHADGLGEFLKKHKGSTLATDKLYKKYGVNPNTKEQDVEVIDSNKDISINDNDFDKKIKLGKFTK